MYYSPYRKMNQGIRKQGKLCRLLIVFLFFIPCAGKAQISDSLTEKFYNQLYSYRFNEAETTLRNISREPVDPTLYEMSLINYGWWMLFTGRNSTEENEILLKRIASDIEKIKQAASGNAYSQEDLLQLILLYSFQSRINKKLGNTLSAVQSFRNSYSYFRQLEPCGENTCEVYNLVSGMYYVLTGYIHKDYPLIFKLAFDDELADINRGLELLSRGIDSPAIQIDVESRYFLMKLHAEVNEDPANALIYADQLVAMFPNNLTYRIYQLTLYGQLGMQAETEQAYIEFLLCMKNNPQLTPNQRRVLMEECHDSIEVPAR